VSDGYPSTPSPEPAEPAEPTQPTQPEQLDEDDLALIAAAGLATADVTPLQRRVLARMSPRAKKRLRWMVDNWPGRVVFRLVAGLRQLQIFDRAMTIAAQTFTSVFPIIIMWVSIFGGRYASKSLGDSGLPRDVENMLDDVASSNGFGAFGIVGVIVVLISATSLSRALTRAYDTIWRGRTRLPPKGAAWRWLAAVMVLAVSLVVSHRLVNAVDDLPPPYFWSSVAIFAVPAFIACFVPWILMAARVPVRFLLPGALLFGLVVLLAHPVSQRYLTTAVQTSAERYGPIGVAFTYLTYLYCVSWALLGTAVLGRVIVIDPGLVGRLIRGDIAIGPEQTPIEEDA
jgi:membrane protein